MLGANLFFTFIVCVHLIVKFSENYNSVIKLCMWYSFLFYNLKTPIIQVWIDGASIALPISVKREWRVYWGGFFTVLGKICPGMTHRCIVCCLYHPKTLYKLLLTISEASYSCFYSKIKLSIENTNLFQSLEIKVRTFKASINKMTSCQPVF